MNDEQLMVKVMAGDEIALGLLVERHHSALLGYLYRLNNGDRALAEDLVQESFLRVLRQTNYQADRPFKPWLYAVATNLTRDHHKSAASRYSVTASSEDERLDNLLDNGPGLAAFAASANLAGGFPGLRRLGGAAWSGFAGRKIRVAFD